MSWEGRCRLKALSILHMPVGGMIFLSKLKGGGDGRKTPCDLGHPSHGREVPNSPLRTA